MNQEPTGIDAKTRLKESRAVTSDASATPRAPKASLPTDIAKLTFKSHKRRHVIARRDGWKCNFCKRTTECKTCNPDATIMATIDHIIPKSQGGTDALTNLAIACSACNRAKASGIWPSPGERSRFSDDPTKRTNDVPRWVSRRMAFTGGAETGSCTRRKQRGRRPDRVYPSMESAALVAASVLQAQGTALVPVLCRTCDRWHLKADRTVSEGRANES